MPEHPDIAALASTLVEELTRAGKYAATAESCTGGWIAKALTDVPGSSACFACGIVSYSNAAKTALLGVDEPALAEHGAVSAAVVRQMAEGAMRLSGADIAVAVSGIAGPDGGSDAKPVGTVWFAWALRTPSGAAVDSEARRFDGNRENVRRKSVIHALRGVRERLAP